MFLGARRAFGRSVLHCPYSALMLGTPKAVATLFLGLLGAAFCQVSENPVAHCVPEFWRNRDAFNDSLSTVTFVFLFDPPFVVGSERIRRERTVPFLCRDRRMKGVFSEMLLEMGRTMPELNEALCVFGGNDCNFDDLIRFVGYAAQMGNRHQFVAGSYLLNMQRRRTKHTIQSAPMLVDSMILMYRNDVNPWPWKDALERIFKPFGLLGWTVIVMFGLILVLCVILFVFRFTPKNRNARDKVHWLCTLSHSRWTMPMKIGWLLLVIMFTIYVAVLLLMYEVSLAVALFRERPPLLNDINQLSGFEKDRISVVGGAASETILRFFLDQEGKYINSTPPWRRGKSLAQMLEWLKTGQVDYVFTFRSSARHTLHKSRMCKKYSAITLNKEEVGGWYYSSALVNNLRDSLDKALNAIFMDRVALKSMEKFGSCELSIGPGEDEISYRVLLLQLGITLVPVILLFLFLLILWKYDCIEGKKKDEVGKEEEGSVETEL